MERLRHHLHNTLTGKQVLLVGCGGTTSDPHFTELFQTLEKINPHGMPRHIPLCTDKDYEQFNTQIPASTAVALRVTRQIHLCALAALLHSSSRGVAWAGRPRIHQNRIWHLFRPGRPACHRCLRDFRILEPDAALVAIPISRAALCSQRGG